MKNILPLILFSICFGDIYLFGQSGTYNINPTTKQVTNLHVKYTFPYFCTYDYDLKRQINTREVETLIVINVNEDGTGSLSIYTNIKQFFTITGCYKFDGYYKLVLENSNGRELEATMNYSKYVDNIYIDIPTNNTALVFFN